MRLELGNHIAPGIIWRRSQKPIRLCPSLLPNPVSLRCHQELRVHHHAEETEDFTMCILRVKDFSSPPP